VPRRRRRPGATEPALAVARGAVLLVERRSFDHRCRAGVRAAGERQRQ